MLFSILLAFLATWLPRDVLPDNASKLWLRAHYKWRAEVAMTKRGGDLRSPAECHADIRSALRDFAENRIASAQSQIDRSKKFIKDYGDSPDPEIQATVRFSRQHIMDKEKDLKWCQEILKMPDRGPIVLPRR